MYSIQDSFIYCFKFKECEILGQILSFIILEFCQFSTRWETYLCFPAQVSSALPEVNNKGMRTPAHIQLNLKKLQVSEPSSLLRLHVVEKPDKSPVFRQKDEHRSPK